MQTIFKNTKWINGLDTLRFILALIVLLSHLHLSSIFPDDKHYSLKLLKLLLGNTFVGVCAVIAFFVISGIVIYLPYQDKAIITHPINYIVRRYLRIGIPMIAVILIAFVFKLNIDIFPFWSLYCELFYYTIFPFLLLLIRKVGINKVLLTTFILSYLLVAYYSNAFLDLINQNKNYNGNYWQLGVFKTCILGLPCWLLGVKIIEDLHRNKHKKIRVKTIYITRLVVLFAAFCCSIARFHLSVNYLLSLNLFAVLAYYWIKQEIVFWVSRNSVSILENAGKWSYSLYLCHALGIVFVNYLFPAEQITITILFLQLVSSLAFSFFFYMVVEKPSHKFIRKIKFDF